MMFEISNPKDLGTVIKLVRKDRGLTQQQLEELSYVESHTISNTERNGYATISTLMPLFDALGIKLLLEVDEYSSSFTEALKIR